MKSLLPSLLSLALILALAACSAQQKTDSDKPADAGMQAATKTDNADLITFVATDIDGRTRQSGEWIGSKPTVVNFWGTWCPPCRREIPDLVRLYKEYEPKGVEIVSLAVKDTPDGVRKFSKRANMEWVMLMGTPELMSTFKLTGAVPTTIFFDSDGQEIARFIGARGYDDFKRAFDAII